MCLWLVTDSQLPTDSVLSSVILGPEFCKSHFFCQLVAVDFCPQVAQERDVMFPVVSCSWQHYPGKSSSLGPRAVGPKSNSFADISILQTGLLFPSEKQCIRWPNCLSERSESESQGVDLEFLSHLLVSQCPILRDLQSTVEFPLLSRSFHSALKTLQLFGSGPPR